MRRLWFLSAGLLVLASCSSEEPDTTAPAPPELSSPVSGTVVTTAQVDVGGSAESGVWVDIYVDGSRTGESLRAVSGSFQAHGVELGGQGAHAVTATATDGAGNGSGHSAPVLVYVDLDAPAATVWSPVDGVVVADAVIDVVGVAEGAVTASLEVDGSVYGDRVVEAGMFRFENVDLGADGTHALRARAEDQPGNAGPWSSAVRVTVDATVPSVPDITWPENGLYLTTAAVSIRGSAPSGSLVEAYVDSAYTGVTAPAVGDTFELTAVPLGGDGVKRLAVVAVDSAQNKSGFSPAVIVRVDTTEPLPPVILNPTSGLLLAARTVDVTGIADEGGTVALLVNSQQVGSVVSSGWEFSFSAVSLAEGTNRLAAEVTDLGGRTSDPSDTVVIMVDTVAPSLSLDFPPDGYVCASESVDVSGTTEEGATVCVNGRSVPVESGGAFSTRTALALGHNLVLVAASDDAGNEASIERAVESYPTEPALELYWPPDSLFTDSTAVTVHGRASVWADVTVGGAAVGVDSAGEFSARVTLDHGHNTVVVSAESPLGMERTAEAHVISDAIPTAPDPVSPADGATVDHGRPRLRVTNSFDPNNDGLSYDFVVYYDASLAQEARREEDVSPEPPYVEWTVAPPLSPDGGTYWWRCRVDDGFAHVWSDARSFSVPDIGSNTPDRYLGFGDSITKGSQWYNGWWVPQGMAYEPELEIALRAFFGAGDVVRRWVDGGLIADVRDSLGGLLVEQTPAYCLVHVGTLDATAFQGGIPGNILAGFRADFEAIVASCRLNSTLPVLSTVCPVDPDTFPGGNQSIEDLNDELRDLAQEEDVPLADHYDAFWAYLGEHPEKILADLLSGDGRHLSDEGYVVMAAEWFMALTGREPGDTEARRPGDAVAERARAPR